MLTESLEPLSLPFPLTQKKSGGREGCCISAACYFGSWEIPGKSAKYARKINVEGEKGEASGRVHYDYDLNFRTRTVKLTFKGSNKCSLQKTIRSTLLPLQRWPCKLRSRTRSDLVLNVGHAHICFWRLVVCDFFLEPCSSSVLGRILFRFLQQQPKLIWIGCFENSIRIEESTYYCVCLHWHESEVLY